MCGRSYLTALRVQDHRTRTWFVVVKYDVVGYAVRSPNTLKWRRPCFSFFFLFFFHFFFLSSPMHMLLTKSIATALSRGEKRAAFKFLHVPCGVDRTVVHDYAPLRLGWVGCRFDSNRILFLIFLSLFIAPPPALCSCLYFFLLTLSPPSRWKNARASHTT